MRRWTRAGNGEPVERLTAQDYYREALVILGEHGSEALTIASVCERLEITKGSFYHHFGSLAGFEAGLLAFWESEHNDRLIALSRAQPDPSLRVVGLVDIAVGLPHAPEAAIRAWGRSEPAVAEVTARVDKRRERHLVDAIAALGVERAQARLLTRIALNMLVGVQQRERPVDLRRLRLMFEELTRLVYVEADPAKVKRMLAHGGR